VSARIIIAKTLASVLIVLGALGCGSRSALEGKGGDVVAFRDARPDPVRDASVDVLADGSVDARQEGPVGTLDANEPIDGDQPIDANPRIDACLPRCVGLACGADDGCGRRPETEITLFGGSTARGLVGDTWTWDGSAWNLRQPSVSPPSISSAAMGYDPTGHRLLIFGGSSVDQQGLSSGVINDTWAWSGANWAHLQTSVTPAGILAPSMATFPPGATVLLFGGQQDNPGRGVSNTWTFIPPILTSVVSRKTHGSAGTFDVDLPLAGSPGIECRSGGANNDYTLVFTFINTLSSVSGAGLTSGTGSVSSSNIDSNDAHQYIVNLTGVTNAQVITVSLNNVTDSVGNFSSAVSQSMGILVGDVNANRLVNSTDTSLVQAQSGKSLSSSNFRTDVNANGLINSTDTSIVQSKSGTGL